MDKRTLLFVLAMTMALFFVNMFFEYRNQESLKEWGEQQKTKKTQKINQLSKQIEERTALPSALPLTFAYSLEKTPLAKGVYQKGSLLVLAWEEPLPQKVLVQENNQWTELQLVHAPQDQHAPALYQTHEASPLTVGQVYDFGSFDLQLFTPQESGSYSVTLATYTDGHFTLPSDALQKLKREADPNNKEEVAPEVGSGIALLKSENTYLPVGYYNSNNKSFITFSHSEDLAKYIKVKEEPKLAKEAAKKEEYYVLENEYQQLVFSNVGAALTEINLPFQSKENPNSVVKPIEYDRDMDKYHPYNAHFPSENYNTPGAPLQSHYVGPVGGYYPLLRRNLIQSDPKKTVRIPPRYYALNIVSEYPEMAELVYQVKEFTDSKIVFEASQNHRRITKTFTLEKEAAPYCLNLTIQIEGDSRGLWLTSGLPEVEWISGSAAPALKYRITRNNRPEVLLLDLPKDSITMSSVYPDWICNSNGFFGTLIDPLTEIDSGFRAQYVSGTQAPSRLVEVDERYNLFKAADLPAYMMMLPLKSTGGTMQFRVFAGPFSDSILKAVDSRFADEATNYSPDYVAAQTFHGWFAFISEPFAKFLFVLMKFFHYLTNSWGFSIILLTVALRLMLYPLNAWSTKSMLKMQQIAPEVTAIQEKHKKDPKKAQLEIMNLYREKGVNPVSGCLPLLIQMPFLIGMFDLLKSTFELRGACFVPGWIDNLTAPDVLFSWGYPIFFIGTQFHLLPILLGAVMFLQQRLMSNLPSDPSLMTEQQRQQRTMGNMMTVVFSVMFYHFPSGLNIYWLSSMLLGILQQWWTQKSMATLKK